MIVWLASYPRSGNTLLRIILRNCFDVWSYGDVATSGTGDPEFSNLGGLLHYSGERGALISRLRGTSGFHFVKTHAETPEPKDRAIYVVRDGRAAVHSYQRFLRDLENLDFTLEQISVGWPLAMTWAQHVSNWIDNPNVLFLRFEDMTAEGCPPLEAISKFIDRPILRPFEIAFSDLNKIRPQYFGVGRNAPGIERVECEAGDTFWRANGEMMSRLGYEKRLS